MYRIRVNGRNVDYETLEAAQRVASDIFDATGVVVGIVHVKLRVTVRGIASDFDRLACAEMVVRYSSEQYGAHAVTLAEVL